MSQVKYSQMSDQELKQYLLKHRDDQSAFEAYLERRHSLPRQTIIKAGELDRLDGEEQVKLVEERLKARFGGQ